MFGYPLVLMCNVHANIDCIECIENETNPRGLYYDIWLDEIDPRGPNRAICSKGQNIVLRSTCEVILLTEIIREPMKFSNNFYL